MKFRYFLLLLFSLSITGCTMNYDPVGVEPISDRSEVIKKEQQLKEYYYSPKKDTASVASFPQTFRPPHYPIDQTIHEDLNGDTIPDTIIYSNNELIINDSRISIALDDPDSAYVKPDSILIVDIHAADAQKEIIIPVSDESYNREWLVFAYNGNTILELGWLSGSFHEAIEDSFPGDGFIYCSIRLWALQTWDAPIQYSLSSGNVIELVKEELYHPRHCGKPPILLESLPLYKTPDSAEPYAVLSPQEITFLALDVKGWCLIKGKEDRIKGWFPFDNSNRLSDLGLHASQVFSNLTYYD